MGQAGVTPSGWLDEPGTARPVDPTIGNHPIAGYPLLGGTRIGSDLATSVSVGLAQPAVAKVALPATHRLA